MTSPKNSLFNRSTTYYHKVWAKTVQMKYLLCITTLIASLLWAPVAMSQDQQDTPTDSTNTEAESAGEEQPATPTPRATRFPIDLEKNKQTLFKQELDKDALVELEAGETTFAALWEFSKSANQFGAILILHGEGQTPDWPNSIDILRNSLTDFGWSTLSISLPDPLPPEIPARSTPTPTPIPSPEDQENGATGDNQAEDAQQDMTKEAPKEAYAEDIAEQVNQAVEDTLNQAAQTLPTPSPEEIEKDAQMRIKAAIAYLHQKGQFNIVIVGEGLGAARAAKYVDSVLGSNVVTGVNSKTKKTVNQRSIRAMVLIQAKNQVPSETKTLPDFFNFVELPILDIYSTLHFGSDTESSQRHDQARKNRLTHYYPYALKTYSSKAFDQENQLTRRIRGFLNKHAKGVEIDKK